MDITLDIEANGLNPTKVWCVSVLKDGWHEPVSFLEPHKFREFLNANRGQGASVWAHNGIGYDYPVLNRLWGVDWSGFVLGDTLVLSRLANPSREGGHKLENWGKRLDCHKLEQPSWDSLSDDMVTYCEQDTVLCSRVLRVVRQELEGFDQRSIDLEHEVATIIAQQRENGWLLNQEACYMLLAKLKERKLALENQVHKRFKPLPKEVKVFEPRYTKDGTLSKVGLKRYGEHYQIVGGPVTFVDYPEFNLGSRQQIGEYLIRFGWKPRDFTETGQPKIDETVLSKVKGVPEAQLISEYLTVDKRIGLVQSWLDAVESDGRVRGYVNSNGAVTGRMTHSDPNVAQVPSNGSAYGTECRSVWTVPEGYKLVGADADGLELRMLAHYMGDAEFTKAVCEGKKEDGTDVHTRNKEAAGLATRDQAKTFIYAFIYGAGDAKIGSIAGGSRNEGAKLKQRFLSNLPALEILKDRVERAASRGWLKGLDGRRIYVGSAHAALNRLLQGGGAVVMKQALVNLNRMARAQKLDFKFVGNIHDEFQAEVREDHAERFGKCAAFAITKAGVDLGLRCPLAAGYDIGNNWAETH